MACEDWLETEERILQDTNLLCDFQTTEEFREAYVEWHRKRSPEEWGSD